MFLVDFLRPSEKGIKKKKNVYMYYMGTAVML